MKVLHYLQVLENYYNLCF